MPNATPQPPYDTDVVIVGAGPVGLTLACALRHHGVRCRVFEERAEPKPYSRANNVWARGQELLASIGVRDTLAEHSYHIVGQTAVLDGKPVPRVELDQVKSPYPQVLYSGQDVIEQTLSERVASAGGAVERGRKVVAFAQDADGVDVTVVPSPVEEGGKHDGSGKDDGSSKGGGTDDGKDHAASPPSGPPERVRCRFLIGADGTAGSVRKALGLDFGTEKFAGRAYQQVDARMTWQRSTAPDQLWFFVYKHGFAGVLPVWGGYHRMFIIGDEAEIPDRDPTLDEIQARGRAATGDETLTFTDPVWFSHGKFSHGLAPHYAQGRVFLVGDAGHTNLPIGGQGMNAGMHDAVALAWRLAMAVAGHAEPVVLESYDAERHGEHARLGDQQVTGLNRLVYRNALEDFALDTVAKAVPDLGARLFGSGDLQQLAVQYPKSPLSEDHLGLRQALHGHVQAPRAGERAPDADVTDGRGNATTLFAHLYNPDGRTWGWSLLAFDGARGDAPPQLLAAAKAVAGWNWVRPRLVVAAPSAVPQVNQVDAGDAPVLADLDEAAHTAYGLDGVPALVLVRPDGHIAFRGPADRPALLRAYCERVFGAAAGAPSDTTMEASTEATLGAS